MKVNIYQEITDKFIKCLSEDKIPWKRQYINNDAGFPVNKTTDKNYNGINLFLLWVEQQEKGYQSALWLTYKQAESLKGSVKRGEKGTKIIYYNFVTKENEKNPEKDDKIPFIKAYTVFNIEQTEGIDFDKVDLSQIDFNSIEACENVLTLYKNKPEIKHNGQSAFYHPSFDYINMPQKDSFISSDAYYCTLFHEAIHSTGHATRLDRLKENKETLHSNSKSYSFEELVAEIGSCFLAIETQIEQNIDNRKAYIQSWARTLKNNPTWIVKAANKAQKAINYIKGVK